MIVMVSSRDLAKLTAIGYLSENGMNSDDDYLIGYDFDDSLFDDSSLPSPKKSKVK